MWRATGASERRQDMDVQGPFARRRLEPMVKMLLNNVCPEHSPKIQAARRSSWRPAGHVRPLKTRFSQGSNCALPVESAELVSDRRWLVVALFQLPMTVHRVRAPSRSAG